MGGAKREMESSEDKRRVALDIAIEAGALDECEFHSGSIYEGSGDLDAAYRLANKKFSQGDVADTFDDRREMTDIIKDVAEDCYSEECPSCAKIRNE